MAEREGFEPSVRVYPGQLLSRQPCSATPAPLREGPAGRRYCRGMGAGSQRKEPRGEESTPGELFRRQRLRAPAPPGHECPGYASTEKPGEPGSWRSGSDFGAGFSRLFVSGVARAFMPGRGGRSNLTKLLDLIELPIPKPRNPRSPDLKAALPEHGLEDFNLVGEAF